MYSMEAPGENTLQAPDPSDVDAEMIQGNFLEFVRVRFNGSSPEGNGDLGTRCSDKFEWHARLRLRNTPQKRWTRDGSVDRETDANDIGPGHVKLITKDDP